MGYERKIIVSEVAERLLFALREENGKPISEGTLRRVNEIHKEYKNDGRLVKAKELYNTEYGFWECPSCHKIPANASADLGVCPFCKYTLTAEEIEAQKERMTRVKKVY